MPARLRRRRVLGTFLLLAATWVPLGCRGRDRPSRLRDADMPALEQQGDSLRAALERHRRRHAAYPAALPETGLPPAALATPFGSWRYARGSERLAEEAGCRGRYSLAVGEYDRHHFELCWDWRRARWYWNR